MKKIKFKLQKVLTENKDKSKQTGSNTKGNKSLYGK